MPICGGKRDVDNHSGNHKTVRALKVFGVDDNE